MKSTHRGKLTEGMEMFRKLNHQENEKVVKKLKSINDEKDSSD